MGDFRKLSETVFASPQLQLVDVDAASEAGFALIINNRPDGEAPDEPQGVHIQQAARAAGMDYVAIPVGHSGFGGGQVEAMVGALEKANGKVLAYCRSGTRSTLLWALAQARCGEDPERIAAAAQKAGYDVSPVRGAIDMLAARARS